jgi:hypothetical protein
LSKLLSAKQAEYLLMEYLHLMNFPLNSLRAENKPSRVESITGLVLWNFRYQLNLPTHGTRSVRISLDARSGRLQDAIVLGPV